MNRKIILIIALSIILYPIMAFAVSDCQLATPRYGVVQCRSLGAEETQHSNFGSFENEWSLN